MGRTAYCREAATLQSSDLVVRGFDGVWGIKGE
jgi:hypothetical protein